MSLSSRLSIGNTISPETRLYTWWKRGREWALWSKINKDQECVYGQKQKSLTFHCCCYRGDVVNEIHYSNVLPFNSSLMEYLFWTEHQARCHVIQTNMPQLLSPRASPSTLTQLWEVWSPKGLELLFRSPLWRPYLIQQWLPEAGLAF